MFEGKWDLWNITSNTATGSNGIPAELFQILKDDAVKVLHSMYQQIWKTQQCPQDWKRSVFIPIPKKGNAKECSIYHTIALISHASKVMLKILQARLQQYVNRELPDVQVGFRKGRPWRRKWQATPVFLPREPHGQKGLGGCDPRGHNLATTAQQPWQQTHNQADYDSGKYLFMKMWHKMENEET